MVQLGNWNSKGIAPVRIRVKIGAAGERTISEPPDRGEDMIGVDRRLLAALADGLFDHLHGVFGQQLQDAYVLPGSGRETLTLLEVRPQLFEAGGQLPAVEHEGMIQRRRPATEDRQVVLGLDDPFAPGVTAWVTGDHAGVGCHFDPIHIRLDRHRLEGPAPRNAVAVRIEPHRLVLVHLGRLRHEWIEGVSREGQSPSLILLEQLADGLRLARHRVVPLGQGARSQIRVQLGQVLQAWNGRRPIPLEIVDAVLDVGLLVASRRHAEPRIETVVARQGRVPRLHLSLTAFQDRRGHRRGVVPPDFPGHAAEEREPLDHPGQDRLRPFAGQRDGEAISRVTPRQEQHRDQPPPVGKVHVDMAEVRLQTPARRMCQRQERLTPIPHPLAHIPPHLVVTAAVAVLIPQPTIQLRHRMLLLTRGLLVLGQDLLDQPLVRTQPRGRTILPQRVRTRLALGQHLPNLPTRMVEPPGDLPNAHPVPMRDSDPAVLFHRQHPSVSVTEGLLPKNPQATEITAVVPFSMPILLPDVGPFYMPISTGRHHPVTTSMGISPHNLLKHLHRKSTPSGAPPEWQSLYTCASSGYIWR